MNNYEEKAKELVSAISELANNEYALENFESYLSHHLPNWYEKFANSPDGLISELKMFADIRA